MLFVLLAVIFQVSQAQTYEMCTGSAYNLWSKCRDADCDYIEDGSGGYNNVGTNCHRAVSTGWQWKCKHKTSSATCYKLVSPSTTASVEEEVAQGSCDSATAASYCNYCATLCGAFDGCGSSTTEYNALNTCGKQGWMQGKYDTCTTMCPDASVPNEASDSQQSFEAASALDFTSRNVILYSFALVGLFAMINAVRRSMNGKNSDHVVLQQEI